MVNLESQSRSNVKGNAWSLAATSFAGSGPESVSSHPSSTSKTTVDVQPDPIPISDNLPSSRSQDHLPVASSVQRNEAESTKEAGFSFFRNLHDEVCRRWHVECDKWNEISTELESQQIASEEGENVKGSRAQTRESNGMA